MIITAIICTYNRADLLARAIESLAAQTFCKSDYEILVVDNGSVDETPRLVEEKQRGIPNLKSLVERARGLSRARNAGIAAAKGRYLAYLDDDAIACPAWLENIVQAFHALQPCPGMVSGPVEPIWGAPRPDWLSNDWLSHYSILSYSAPARFLQEKEWIAGVNMAIPADVIQNCGGFDERLGRKGKSLLCGEETALTDRIRSKGYSIYYDPSILVSHYIHPERLSKTWLYRRCFWGGVARGIRKPRAVSHQNYKGIYERLRSREVWLDPNRRLRLTGDLLREIGHLYGLLL